MSGFGLVEITLHPIGSSQPSGGGLAGGVSFEPAEPGPIRIPPVGNPSDYSGQAQAVGDGIGVTSITPEIAEAIREIGGEPAQYNRVEWPIGASRHMVARFIVHGPVAQLMLSDSTASPMLLKFGDIVFSPVFVRNPVPLLISEATGPVYAIEVVDERFHWQKVGSAKIGFNLSDPSKEPTEDETPRDAVEHLFAELGIAPELYELPDPEEEDPLGDPLDLRDVVGSTLPAAVLIDKILTATGHVLTAYPSTEYFGAGGVKYRVIPIDDGEADARQALSSFTHAIIAGGIHSPSGEFVQLNTGSAKHAAGPVHLLDFEVPSAVVVNFPLVKKGGGFDDQRFYPIESNDGSPVGVESHPVKVHVQDVAWARRIPMPEDQPPGDPDPGADIENFEALELRAAKVARRYFARFKAGCGEWLMKGIREVKPYSGAQVICWHLTLSAVTTRVRGTIDDPLFGFRIDTALAARDVFSTGGVRALARSDGSMLIDGGEAVPYEAIAAEPVPGETWNWEYDLAQCDENLTLLLDGGEPAIVINKVRNSMERANTGTHINNGQALQVGGATFTPTHLKVRDGNERGAIVWVRFTAGVPSFSCPIPVNEVNCA